jgi:hypothetical protein
MIIESNKEKEHFTDSLTVQIELSHELARIALACPTCRELFKQVIQSYKIKRSLSDPSARENQTVSSFMNPNNDSRQEEGAVISNEINSL